MGSFSDSGAMSLRNNNRMIARSGQTFKSGYKPLYVTMNPKPFDKDRFNKMQKQAYHRDLRTILVLMITLLTMFVFFAL